MTSNLSAVISSLSPHSVYNVSIAASTGTSGLGTPTILSINTGSALSNESHHSLSSSISSRSSSSSTKSSVTVSITSKSTLSHTTEGNKVTMKSSSSPSDTQSHTNANTSLQDLPVIVAGSLTAGLVLIFLLGVLIYHCLKNKKRRQKEQNYMMFYAYEDIGSLHPEDPARNNRLQQTQLTSPEVRKATSYGCKQDVSILKTQVCICCLYFFLIIVSVFEIPS
uniref:Uncharacterized protein n=1 Tax=Octopus bimaculoides TaxID=37653 RepID=A0A0L8HC55_OCTBM|eukprot:XP_014773927.1 PREDICTED: uncharacterized serine-rich protein C215.13-like [Octopus bimaculoides]